MGTAVLSPRDCLTTSHDTFYHQTSEMLYSASAPKSRRSAFPASVVQRVLPSLTSDHTGRSLKGATVLSGERELRNGATGLLPVPVSGNRLHPHNCQTKSSTFFSPRHFSSNVSLPIRQSSASPAPPAPHSSSPSATRSSFSNGKLPSSRSASTGFLSRGLRREILSISEGRFPLKAVQNNGVVNETVASTRFTDSKSRVEKIYVGGSEDVGDLRKKTHLDFSPRSFVDHDGKKPSVEEGRTLGQRKEVEGKRVGKGRQFEKSKKNASSKVVDFPPSFTILQRPKTKEAADELIASFLGEVASLTPNNGISKLDNLFTTKEHAPPSCNAMELEVPSTDSGSEDSIDGDWNPPIIGSAKINYPAAHGSDLVTKRGSSRVTRRRSQEHVDTQVIDLVTGRSDEVTFEVQIGNGEMEVDKWFSSVGTERWAGPAYSNSPPPSSLPLPKFSTKLTKSWPSESSPVDLKFEVSVVSSPSACTSSAPRTSHSLRSWMPVYESEGARDVAFATENLRRILNLDS